MTTSFSIKKAQLTNADALSRLPLPQRIAVTTQLAKIVLLFEQLRSSPVTADQIRKWTRKDPVLSNVRGVFNKGGQQAQYKRSYDHTGKSNWS